MPDINLGNRKPGQSSSHQLSPSSTSNNKIPSPQASSTPKKGQNGGQVNGLVNGHSGKKRPPTSQGGSPKKRKVTYMDDSDEETTIGVRLNGSMANGHMNGKNGHINNPSPQGGSKRRERNIVLQEQRKQLPIARGRDALVREIQVNDTVVLLGETGSGKTTQVPQYILESGIAKNGVIAVTQPRRVAATSLAHRVAQEQDTAVGKLVGYSVRFDDCSSPETRIKYVTDGMLARELHSDPELSRYSVIILDEAHERSLHTDVLVSALKGIQKTRNSSTSKESAVNPLKIIIMSATLDAEKFSQFYDNAKVIYVKGRQHPVTIYHTVTSQNDYVDSAMRTFFQIHVDQPPGDVLIFLPGQDDIESLDKSIKAYEAQLPSEQMRVITCPLYAALPQTQQSKVFAPTPIGKRKCILATNIAETSITIPGVKYVIDSGKCKEKRHISRQTGSGMDTLLTQDISKSSAMQRTGRAGREGKGFCFRLYTEADFNQLVVSSVPEIQRCSLTSSMLQMKCLGLDLATMEFMDKPDDESVASSLKTLYILGAIGQQKELTDIGREMNQYPLEPPLARALLASKQHGCPLEAIDLLAVLSYSSKLFFDNTELRDEALEARRKFHHPSGDHLTTLNTFRAYQEIAGVENKAGRKDWCRKHFLNERTLNEAMNIRDQLRKIAERNGLDWKVSCGDNLELVLKSILRGMSQHTAMIRPDGTYKQIFGLSTVKIHPGSTLSNRKTPVIVYDELVFTGSSYARGVSAIPPSFISELPMAGVRTSS